MPLALAPEGNDLQVIKILADEGTKKHLTCLGITANSTIKVVSHSDGNVILEADGARIVLDGSLAMEILVA